MTTGANPAIAESESNYKTCGRCGTVTAAHARTCDRCGVAWGPTVRIEVATRIRMLDALIAGDLDEIVRLTLDAHADGLLEVTR
jgi:ribosomal protein L40E